MVIHVNDEPDIRFLCPFRKMLLDVLKVVYLEFSKNINLPIYGVVYSSLSKHEKTVNDVKKGILSKEPNDLLRLEEEDLVKMNLDEAICAFSDQDEEDNTSNDSSGSNGMEI